MLLQFVLMVRQSVNFLKTLFSLRVKEEVACVLDKLVACKLAELGL